MEQNNKLNRLLTSTLLLTSLGLSSFNIFAKEVEPKDDVKVVNDKSASTNTAENQKDETTSADELYSKTFEKGRHFHQIKFNQDKSSYSLVPTKETDESEEEKLIEIKESDIFYIKHGTEPLEQKSKKSQHHYSFEWDDEQDEDCWNFGKRRCNNRDGFHFAFSAVSSSGDDLYTDSGETTDLNTYTSYRIQLASFFIESPGMATRRIHGLYAGRAWGFNFFNSDEWRLDLYKQRDTQVINELEGIQVRNKHTRSGLRLTGFFDSSLLQMNVSPYSSSDQENDGVAASISYSQFWQVKNWNFYGIAGVQYQPKEVVSFYETQPTTFENRSDRINQDVEFGFEYPLGRRLVIGGFASYSQSNISIPGVVNFENVSSDGKVNGFRSGLLISLVL